MSAALWQWESDDGATFNDFFGEHSKLLEMAFSYGNDVFEIKEKCWLFNFRTMIQTCTKPGGTSRRIKRVLQHSPPGYPAAAPSQWQPPPRAVHQPPPGPPPAAPSHHMASAASVSNHFSSLAVSDRVGDSLSWRPDSTLFPAPPEYFTRANAGAIDTAVVLRHYASCPVLGHDVAAVIELSNPDLTAGFESRLVALRNRHGKPAFQPTFGRNDPIPESHLQQRKTVLDIFRAHARPLSDPAYGEVTIAGMWHGTHEAVLPSIMGTSFANLASTDCGYFGKGIYTTMDAEYAHRCYASWDHAGRCRRDTGVLLFCSVSVFSAFVVIGRNEMEELRAKANYKNYDAHLVPVAPRDPSNANEFEYYPTEAGRLQDWTYTELVLFDPAQARYRVGLFSLFFVTLFRCRFCRVLSSSLFAAQFRALSCRETGFDAKFLCNMSVCCKAKLRCALLPNSFCYLCFSSKPSVNQYTLEILKRKFASAPCCQDKLINGSQKLRRSRAPPASKCTKRSAVAHLPPYIARGGKETMWQ